MLWITTGNQKIINHHCRKCHSKNTHYRRYSSPFANNLFGIDTLDLCSRHHSCLFHPYAKGTRKGTSLHFPKLCCTDILRIKFATGTHARIYFASRLCSAVEKQNLAFHHINSINHDIILREVERVRCFYIILAFYGLHICFWSDISSRFCISRTLLCPIFSLVATTCLLRLVVSTLSKSTRVRCPKQLLFAQRGCIPLLVIILRKPCCVWVKSARRWVLFLTR